MWISARCGIGFLSMWGSCVPKQLWTLSPCVSRRLLRRKQASEVVRDHHLIPCHLNSYCNFGFKCWVLDNGELSEFINTVVPWLNPHNNTVAIAAESGLTHCCFSVCFEGLAPEKLHFTWFIKSRDWVVIHKVSVSTPAELCCIL